MSRVTLKQLSAELSLAVSTISDVLNGRDTSRVAPETRVRIFEAVERHGYRPNLVSRAMRTASTRTVGVSIAAAGNSEPNMRRLSAIESYLFEHGYAYLPRCGTGAAADVETTTLNCFLDRGVDGVIYSPIGRGVSPIVRQMIAGGLPVVLVGQDDELPCVQVRVDHEGASRRLLEYVHARGRRRPVFLRAVDRAPFTSTLTLRSRGWRLAYEQLYGSWERAVELQGEPRGDISGLGCRLAGQLLASDRRFDAVICENDLVAAGASATLQDAGVCCGMDGDVLVTGYDDLSITRHFRPRLVTVRQPAEQAGRLAAELLLAQARSEHPRGFRVYTLDAQVIDWNRDGEPIADQVVAAPDGANR